jgi:hypothetical protein
LFRRQLSDIETQEAVAAAADRTFIDAHRAQVGKRFATA